MTPIRLDTMADLWLTVIRPDIPAGCAIRTPDDRPLVAEYHPHHDAMGGPVLIIRPVATPNQEATP